MNADIATRRLRNQLITRAGLARAADVVAWFGAMQAQVYDAAKWAIGLRMREATLDADLDRAFAQGRILRTHVMRPTWHFVTPADIRWLLELTAPRVLKVMSSYHRQLELNPRLLVRAASVMEAALAEGTYLTRAELAERLRRAKLACDGDRLAHVAMFAELEGVICSGPRRDKQFTYALLAERAPKATRMSRDEALAMLSHRYFRAHGPATARDFAWWSGLTVGDANRGLEINKAKKHEIDGRTYWTVGPATRGTARHHPVLLLPIYDEYLVAYRDRDAVPHWPLPADTTFQHALVIDGQVAGTWRTTRGPRSAGVEVIPLRPLARGERRAIHDASARYGQFVGVPVTFSIR